MDRRTAPARAESLKAMPRTAIASTAVRLLTALDAGEPALEELDRTELRELHTLGTVTLTALCKALSRGDCATCPALGRQKPLPLRRKRSL
jgi:hypothetical protein